jgi:hypothetical protein
MTKGKLLALVIAGAAALGGGWYFGVATQPAEQTAIGQGPLMFPDLAAKLSAVRRIELISKTKKVTIERKGDTWGVTDRDGYPVLDSKLRGLLTALTELRLTEARTTDPASFGRLGLEDPESADKAEGATLLRLLDADGKPIVALIAGHRRTRTQGNLPEDIYVRRAGDNHTWLAQGGLVPDSDPTSWVDRSILDISHGVISKVVSTKGGGTLTFERDGDKLKMTQPADHPKLEDYKVDDIPSGLEALTLQDVMADKNITAEPLGTSVFSTTDGLDIHFTLFHIKDNTWVRIAVAAPERGKAEAERLNAKVSGWLFELPSWKDRILVPSLDDLLPPPPPPAPAAKPKP